MTARTSSKFFASESDLVAGAADAARAWRDLMCESLLIGLQGQLGSGKTTWARGLLGGLGYSGRVPSPTYTLVEQYSLDAMTVVHADLYRLDTAHGDHDLDALGLRDWLARDATWVVVEWPERSPSLSANIDLTIGFECVAETGRTLVFGANTATGMAAVEKLARSS